AQGPLDSDVRSGPATAGTSQPAADRIPLVFHYLFYISVYNFKIIKISKQINIQRVYQYGATSNMGAEKQDARREQKDQKQYARTAANTTSAGNHAPPQSIAAVAPLIGS
ncbi:hypothetical protein Vretifemale_8408, partial [Volvox reticuliferus]